MFIVSGTSALERLGRRLDDLHAATDAPVTARRPWLQTWAECYPQFEPWVIGVADDGGALRGVAPLARRSHRGLTDIIALGDGPSDEVRVPARDADAVDDLADAVTRALRGCRAPWRLAIRRLPAGDPVSAGLIERLRSATRYPGESSPMARLGSDRRVRTYVSASHHQQVRKMRNRLQREGLEPVFDHTRDPAVVAATLPTIVSICRARDALLSRRSIVDHAHAGAFFRRIIVEAAGRGELELLTLRIGGELAAYALCFVDGSTYRLWNGRMAPAWSQFSPGRLINDAVLARALEQPACTAVDWMRGEEDYKRSMSNEERHAESLYAWSSVWLRSVEDAPRRVKVLLKERDRDDRLRNAWTAVEEARYRIAERLR